MLSQNLKKYREKKGLSQKKLAGLVNMSQQGYAKYETGSATPDPERLALIAEILEVSVDQILSYSEKNPIHVDEPLGMTEKEKTVIRAYRSKPEMQPAVDKLLGIEEVKHEYYTAAYKDDSTIETNEEQFNYLLSIPSTTDDLMGGQNKK